MPDLVVYGFPQSTYVRTVRMVCEEKGVAHRLEGLEMRTPSHLALHPWGRMPVLQHGDVTVFETAAISRYIDRAFPGPRLIPSEPVAEARMEQWLSAIVDYVVRATVGDVVLRRLGIRPADEELIAAGHASTLHSFAVFDAALERSEWLAGGSLSLADLLLAPIVFYYRMLPEGEAIRRRFPALERWYGAIEPRPSFAATMPHLPGARAAA